MSMTSIRPDSLVLYKTRPARVVGIADKIEIELDGGQAKRVRDKDVQLLHPGPLRSLSELGPREGELEAAWELLQGARTDVRELSELMFGEFSPATAWACWERVAQGLHFRGTPEAIEVRSSAEVEADLSAQASKQAAERDWAEFLERLGQGQLRDPDRERLREVEALATDRAPHSRILQALGHQESRENAHRLLISSGYWQPSHNPYPARLGLPWDDPSLPVPALPDEPRRDLTHMSAFAVDDDGNRDPDDAVSLDGDRIWVHVADVSAVAEADGELDLEARTRGANLYIPERTVNMLPEAVTERLGLGLQEISPALSFGFRLGAAAEPLDLEVVPSWIRVTRVSYEQAMNLLGDEPFRSLVRLTGDFRERRQAQGAVRIELPEVSVRVADQTVRIRPLPRLQSREMITDAMLMAGEATARYCFDEGIPIPFATQPEPDRVESPADLAAMYAYRRQLKPSRLTVEPSAHFGLGLGLYTRVTSPLRRYSDLLVHQQLRAHLAHRPTLTATEVAARVDAAESAGINLRRAERLSNLHWKLVYLRDNPQWRGPGTVVSKDGPKATVLIPDLAMESRVRLRGDRSLNDEVKLSAREIDLPELVCYFRVKD